MKKVTISITLDVDDGVTQEDMEQVAGNCFVQLETLSDDMGSTYENAKVEVRMGDAREAFGPAAEMNDAVAMDIFTKIATYQMKPTWFRPESLNAVRSFVTVHLDAIDRARAD